jgi:hypothetical protein
VKRITLKEANGEGQRCVKREQLHFANPDIQLSFTYTLSTKEKKNIASTEKGGLLCTTTETTRMES